MPRDNARHKRYVYVRRGKLDVQLRVPCRRDVIFSCCNSSLSRETREPPSSRGCRCVSCAALLFHGRVEETERSTTNTCVYAGSRRVTNSLLSLSLTFFTFQFTRRCASHVGVLPTNFAFKREMLPLDLLSLSLS